MPAKVTDYMATKVISIAPDTGVRDAFFTMREHGIRHLPVVGEDGKLEGIVSDRELRRPDWVDEARDLAHVYYLDDDMLVRDVMIRHVHLVHTYDTLRKAARVLVDHHVGAVPVLDKTESLVGMLSAVDLLRALTDMIDQR
ncbi:MAG: CBS domain-containing protein [Gammaproteobacteria bacterium]|nr:MAG: CBS domain-containing protein [Gammaproteobacteria bacterium]